MASAARKNFDDIVDVMLWQDSSDDSSSSEDELDDLLLEFMFPLQNDKSYPRINLQDIPDVQCKAMFRFAKGDMKRLRDALQLPANYICSQGTIATGMEALMILLRRLAYPNRWCDLVPVFGRTISELSLIFNKISPPHTVDNLDLVWLDPEAFADAVYEKGAPLTGCWGFIDGTPRPIARPVRNQRIMYSRHKRSHCLKFQSVQAPNGMIAHMFGPIEGRRHDAFMLGVSGLSAKLRRFVQHNGKPYVIYGDPAYGITQNIISPFRQAHLTDDEQEFNTRMSKVQTCVEWGFAKICQNFAYLDFKKNLKILLQPVGKYYLLACILINCHTCFYGSQTSTYFNLEPPSVETYLSNQ
ncbi:hypothetical protein P5673_009318 [Acropora cervicornis]|uniref:DDE Tnp4 domain-containing protein n=1 Tax=Acropora cervicornis TaxID=6130 RepID=A0AAD9VA83_ACRCE|nr:hypothetical protein P5673_009318 [Acropora cervicornis]